MQRYILDTKTKYFYKEDLFHIKNVMRMKSGDKVELCLDNKCFLASINIGETVSYEYIEDIAFEQTLNITLVQGILKGSKLDTTIKYSTIFGAKNIILTEFERSIAKLKNSDHKIDRYIQIAKEAAELSHREMIPHISVSDSLKRIDFKSFDLVILADEEEKELSIKDIKDKISIESSVCIIIGPEGGISNNERLYLKNIGASLITLGKYIYPAEIAAISLLEQLK